MTAKPTRFLDEKAKRSRIVGEYGSSSVASGEAGSLAAGRRKSRAGMAAGYVALMAESRLGEGVVEERFSNSLKVRRRSLKATSRGALCGCSHTIDISGRLL
jgi:hypothetical protein